MKRWKSLETLSRDVCRCRRCPRLVAWREAAAQDPPARFRGAKYWARPVPGFGDPEAWLLVVGLAPAAHGGNRTGRVFTGDRSGDWLFRALHRAGLANQPTSVSRDDGLELRGTYVTASVKCAPPGNRPTPEERDDCRPYLEGEFALLGEIRVVAALGEFAYRQVLRLAGARGPAFGHGVRAPLGAGRPIVLASFHPSQQNTFTGKLTEEMFDAIFRRALALR